MSGRRSWLFRGLGAALSLVLALGAFAPAQSATSGIGSCAPNAPGAGPFYPGPSASAVYNTTFAAGFGIPYLSSYTPQGLTTWNNWDGNGNPLFVLGMYRRGSSSLLVGIDPATGQRVGTVRIAESHLGAIGVVSGFLIAQRGNGNQVLPYKLATLRSKLMLSAKTGTKPSLSPAGKAQSLPAAKFMSVYGSRAWIGDYATSRSTSKMREYKVSSKGRLSQVGSAWEVPLKTQGVLVTANRFIFVSGLNSGSMTVIARGQHNLDRATGRCFTSPSNGENIVMYAGKAYAVYEGGSNGYSTASSTRNKIKNFHTADLTALSALTNP